MHLLNERFFFFLNVFFDLQSNFFVMRGVLMLSFVSWQDYLLAESDDDDVEVSERLQEQFVTFIDCVQFVFSVF